MKNDVKVITLDALMKLGNWGLDVKIVGLEKTEEEHRRNSGMGRRTRLPQMLTFVSV